MHIATRKKWGHRRQDILEAATEAFFKHGYQAASVRDIAREAGITQATVYYHFQSKEDILHTIVAEFSDHLFLALRSTLLKDGDPVERLRGAVTQHIMFTKTHRKQVKIIIEDKSFLGEERLARIREKEKAIFNLYRAYLGELEDMGLVRDLDLTTTTFSILGTINWLYHWYRAEKRLTIERVADEILDLLFGGLLSGQPCPRPAGKG